MKIRISFVLVILNLTGFVNLCQGQLYHKFIEHGKYWEVFHMYYPNICGMSGGERSFFDRDTVISGTNYSILSAYQIVNVNPGPFCYPLAVDTSLKFDVAILREDTILKRVYKYDLNLNDDTLLFEFGLNVGDTLKNYAGYAPPQYVVDSIGSITLLDGSSRPVYYTIGNVNQLEFVIEGIGGSRGPYYTMGIAIDGEDFIACYSENGIHLWGDNLHAGISMNCLGLVGINENIANTINTFQITGLNGCLFIENLTKENGVLCLNDISGKKVFENLIRNSELTLNIETLKPGIYIYCFTTESKLRYTGKLKIN